MKYASKKFSRTALAVACAACVGAEFAHAEGGGFQGLEEITVTASKRVESLQDVGMSITALSDQELQRMGANTILDFAVRVPNLGMAYATDGRFDASSPSLRGVFGDGTTGFYIDDTPVNSSIMPRVMDVERIEVLRGPQGSLYGARSMGGTIRIITKQPELDQTFGALHTSLSSVKEGDLNSQVDGSINIPVIEGKFAVRIAGYYGQNSGIYDREYQSSWVEASSGNVRQNTGPAFSRQANVDDEDFWGGQIVGKLQVTENLTFVPKFMMQKVDADGLPFADYNANNTTEMRFFNSNEPGSDEWNIASGTFNWETDPGTFVSTTSWYDRKTDETEEEASFLHWLFNNVIDLPIDPLAAVLTTVEKYESFTHETRFTSNIDGPLQFTLGVFYSDQEWDHKYPPSMQPGLNDAIDTFTDFPGLAADCEFGFCLVPEDLIYVTHTQTDTKEIAGFGELTYAVSDWLSLTAGGRWYKTKVDAVNAANGFANGGPTSFDKKTKESGFNPKFLVEAAVTEDVNVYATAAKGFRIGGVNGNLSETLCGAEIAELGINRSDVETYDSDKLWSYEVGVKSTLADNRLTLNAAAYLIDWKNIQQQNLLACGFQFYDNTGEAESKGFEVEMQAAPMEGLTLSVGVGYTNAEITDAGDAAGVADGDKIQGVPDWTFNGSVDYQWALTADWQGMVRADANYYGDSYSANNEASLSNQRLRDSWSTINLRTGVLNDQWEVMLFADNVLDERANLADNRSIAAETPGRSRIVTNRPRTLGLEARMRF